MEYTNSISKKNMSRGMLWISLSVVFLVVANVCHASETDASDDTEVELAPKTLVKRNVAWWARSGRQKFYYNPQTDKRNVAWVARTGGRDTVLFPSTTKRDFDGETAAYDPYSEEELEDYPEAYEPYVMDKRNLASLVNSRTIPSFITDYKRHIGPSLSYKSNNNGYYDFYDRPNKRYFASLLKSETPPSALYPSMQRRYSYFPEQSFSKRFFTTLLENADSAPGEDMDEGKRGGFSSLLKSDTPFQNGKRSFASLLKSDSGVGMPGKRYYSSLLDDSDIKDKRFIASLLKSKSLKDVEQGPSSQLLGSIYDRQGYDIEKRHFSSLINRRNPYSNGKHITKRHVASLRDTSKRFYGSLLDNTKDDKRSFGALLKSSSYQRPSKKNIGAALRYRPGKRDPSNEAFSDEEMQLDALQKRFLGSLLDTTSEDKLYEHSKGKRHFGSLLDNRDTRSDVLYDEDAYPLENNDDKRHMSSLLDNRPASDKRFLGSLLDSKDPYNNIPGEKRFLGSAINSRMNYKNDDKRFLGSAINSRMNFKNDDEKRFLGSAINSRMNFKNDDEKRFLGSTINSRMNFKNNDDKRFLGSAINSRTNFKNGDDKRFLGSAINSRTNFKNGDDKRFLGSAINSRMNFKNDDDKRFLGSAINSRTNFKNGDDKGFLGSAINSRMNYINENKRFLGYTLNSEPESETEERFVGSIAQSKDNNQNMNEDKRFFASVLDNTRKSDDLSSMDKRFLGSTLKSKSPDAADADLRSKRDTAVLDDIPSEDEEENSSNNAHLQPKRDAAELDDISSDAEQENSSLMRSKRSPDYSQADDGPITEKRFLHGPKELVP